MNQLRTKLATDIWVTATWDEYLQAIADPTNADDKGEKRLLYEDLGVAEYWIIDVQNVQVIAFGVTDGGSKRKDDLT